MNEKRRLWNYSFSFESYLALNTNAWSCSEFDAFLNTHCQSCLLWLPRTLYSDVPSSLWHEPLVWVGPNVIRGHQFETGQVTAILYFRRINVLFDTFPQGKIKCVQENAGSSVSVTYCWSMCPQNGCSRNYVWKLGRTPLCYNYMSSRTPRSTSSNKREYVLWK
jgi:hypothetical protein